ncbi:MAG: hypothetical protein ACFFAJ_06035, partial [Candidatus Hodarchaeota archaeon]
MEDSPDALLSSLDLKIQLLLSRCGIGTSSSTDNRIIFLNNLIRHYWEESNKKLVELDALIEGIQDPPFDKIGSLSVDKFISKTKRIELARNINALMVRAVPGVELDFDKLIDLAKKEQKVPIIVFDLRKITDPDERNTFVAEILGEVQRWAWSKGGTSRLRAILYFDELYGFMPAGALSPPSKTALLILLKQARAAGLGCVLATQNPGDLDYRGLSNIATWVLGRLATNQDIAKVQGALKPVFEGAGGTEEEFRNLMSQIRALKPGNFIAYNPRYGVNSIQTRWLLSLHKGPLTNAEIKSLTLRPPKPEKKKKKKKEVAKPEIKEVESVTELQLVNKKPSLGKITERFLIPKIDLDPKKVSRAIFERISSTGDPEVDGFSVEVGESTSFYSPIFFSKTLINIKRSVKEGSVVFPVEITEEMSRSYDLSKSIDWNSTTVEGIHASSLPPQDLTLSSEDGFKFHDVDKEIIDKLPDNLTWYFTQSPFPEAGSIYQKRLRDFERAELEKIAGKKSSKAFKRLSSDISKIEERIETENVKLDETIARLENLQAEKRAREAEGKSIRATERSIDSSENKLKRHEERKDQLQKQLQTAEKKRQDMLMEHKSEYETFHKTIETLKSRGAPRDLYRPGKADINIMEQAIYWTPRLLIPVIISGSNNEGMTNEHSFNLNLNLYNGNAEIPCNGCGPQISTENYYQSLLANEISPPTFVCTTCLKFLCSEHITFCELCGKTACFDHADECNVCKKALCYSCLEQDVTTNEFYCEEHIPKLCEGCGKSFDPELLSTCKKCKTLVCNECGRVKVKIKNEEVVARCVNCS